MRASRILLIALALGACKSGGAEQAKLAPSFKEATLQGATAEFDPVRVKRPTLFAFWASWCASCKKEVAILTQLYQRERDRLDIIGVNVDRDREKAETFAASARIPYASVLDPELKVSDLFAVTKTPTFVLVGVDGRIAYSGDALDDALFAALEHTLGAKATAKASKPEAKKPEDPQLIQLEDAPYYERRDGRMGTEVQIIILTTDDAKAKAAADAALEEISRIEALMTDWNETSPLMAINHAAGKQPVAVDRELLELLEVSKQMSEVTEGAFDVTFAAAGRLWDFKSEKPQLPDPEAVKQAVSKIDYRKMIIDHEAGTAFLAEEGMRIGLGGIAKGYAVERAARIIKMKGFDDFAIKAGGDMRVMGLWNKKPWKIGIRDPRDREGTLAVLPVSNVAISTAGDYERYFDLDGKRYGHIIDPRTGYPVQHTWSVTIVARDCTLSDGLDDGVFVLGADKGMALVESLPDVQAVIVDAKGQLHVSKGLEKR